LVFASFLASAVEGVEALTIVLAVGVTRGWRSTLVGVGIALVILAGLAAQGHPAPIWPDAMSAPASLHTNSSAAVWASEQLLSHQFDRSALWAALRAMTLVGCALLAYVSWRSLADSRTPSTVPGAIQ